MGFHIGSLEVRYYGIIISTAIIVAFFLASYLFKKEGYKENLVYHLLFLIVPLGIIGTRIWYVIFNPNFSGSVFAIWEGGLAIQGAILVGILVVFGYARYKKAGFFTISDIVVIVVILAQAIGRWGNMTNILGGSPEGIGHETTWHVFPFTTRLGGRGGVPHLSFWFFESMLNLLGFFLLWMIFKRQNKFGTTTAAYLIWYGVVRAATEPLRSDSLTIFGSSDFVLNRIAVVLSIIFIICGILILVANKKGWINQDNKSLKEGN